MRKLAWLVMMVLAALVVLSGCASNMTEYERADRMNLTLEAYNMCRESRHTWNEDASVPLPKKYIDLKREMEWNKCGRRIQ